HQLLRQLRRPLRRRLPPPHGPPHRGRRHLRPVDRQPRRGAALQRGGLRGDPGRGAAARHAGPLLHAQLRPHGPVPARLQRPGTVRPRRVRAARVARRRLGRRRAPLAGGGAAPPALLVGPARLHHPGRGAAGAAVRAAPGRPGALGPRPPLRAHHPHRRGHLRGERWRLQDHPGGQQLVHRGGRAGPRVPPRRDRGRPPRGPGHPPRRPPRRPLRAAGPGPPVSATGTRHRSAPRHRSLSRQTIDRIAVAVYGAVDWLVIMGPALAVKLAADRGGMGDTEGLDLVIASALVATPHAIVAARRLRYEERTAVRRADMWIASIDSLVVLALGATIPLVVLLWGITEEHVTLSG